VYKNAPDHYTRELSVWLDMEYENKKRNNSQADDDMQFKK